MPYQFGTPWQPSQFNFGQRRNGLGGMNLPNAMMRRPVQAQPSPVMNMGAQIGGAPPGTGGMMLPPTPMPPYKQRPTPETPPQGWQSQNSMPSQVMPQGFVPPGLNQPPEAPRMINPAATGAPQYQPIDQPMANVGVPAGVQPNDPHAELLKRMRARGIIGGMPNA